MFDGIQHIGYFVADLDIAVAWFERTFGAVNDGGGPMAASRIVPGGGRNAFVRFGAVEAELMQLTDSGAVPANTLVMHHVGYVVADIAASAEVAKAKGLRFLADAPNTNVMGQQVLYFDPDTTNGVWMHLTQVPARSTSRRGGEGPEITSPEITGIVHPGYLVRDLDAATAWHVDKLGGRRVGGGPSRSGGRVAFIDCGGAQIELIELPDAANRTGTPVLDHVGYRTETLDSDLAAYRRRGLRFATDAPAINPIGQKLIYFDTAVSMGARMHLTELPTPSRA